MPPTGRAGGSRQLAEVFRCFLLLLTFWEVGQGSKTDERGAGIQQRIELSQEHLRAGNVDLALGVLRDLTSRVPASMEGHALLAYALQEKGVELSEAAGEYERALDLLRTAPDSSPPWRATVEAQLMSNLGRTRWQLGEGGGREGYPRAGAGVGPLSRDRAQ